MKHYAVLNQNSEIVRYGTCPDDMLELQAGDGESVIEHDGLLTDLHRLENGAWIFQDEPGQSIDYSVLINQACSVARQRYMTAIFGQETVYSLKIDEARTYIATGEIGPFIEAELGITADTPDQITQIWLNLNDFSKQKLAEIEQIRLNALKDPSADQLKIVHNLLSE